MTEQDKTIQDLKREIAKKDELITHLEKRVKYFEQQLIFQDRFSNRYLVERISKYENCTNCMHFLKGKCQEPISPYSDVPYREDPQSTTQHREVNQFDWCEIWEARRHG